MIIGFGKVFSWVKRYIVERDRLNIFIISFILHNSNSEWDIILYLLMWHGHFVVFIGWDPPHADG
tara:strand:+ start:270 stop:464 length:195 start_codon:yes stop_codon:yes gene_type:complete